MSQQVAPTRMAQQVYKSKKKAAEGGHKLLKKKADALKVKFRDYAKHIAETKSGMSTDASSAFFSLTQAEYAAGNFKQKVAEGNMSARVRIGAGATADNQSLGLIGGGKKIVSVREKFTVLLDKLIRLASLQTSFVTLDEAMKVTNRRVNALENVTIPKIEAILKHIERELDELEREDYTRLKLVQKKKEEALKEQAKQRELAGHQTGGDEDIMAGFDQDDDVVF